VSKSLKKTEESAESLNKIFTKFKHAFLKYHKAPESIFEDINGDCLKNIWDIYLNVFTWETFCETNRIDPIEFDLIRQVISFDRVKHVPGAFQRINEDIIIIINETKNKQKSNLFLEFSQSPSLETYNKYVDTCELAIYDHARICDVIEKNCQSFTIGDIIDHWKAIHKKHDDLSCSSKKNTFTFASLLA
jgi:hypothetical protein